ncbi:MAG: hypothetical protein WBA46_08595 [Thermomicrobiales bacterium]
MGFYPTTTENYTLYPSAVRGATAPTAVEFYADGRKNVRIDINVSAITGTNVTFKVQGFDPAANGWFDLLTGAAQTGAARSVLQLGPEIATATNVGLNTSLPARMRLVPTNTAITNVTYSASITKSY